MHVCVQVLLNSSILTVLSRTILYSYFFALNPSRSSPHRTSSARACPKKSGPHSAAKQRRSFCVPAPNHPGPCVPKGSGPHSAAKQRLSSSTGNFLTLVRLSGLEPGSKDGPSRARVCPKESRPHSAAKQRRSFCVLALNLILGTIKDWTQAFYTSFAWFC